MKSKFDGLPKRNEAVEPPRRAGRPKGNAGTSPDAEPVTLRISRDVYKRAQKAVIDADDGRPLSRVVEDLLADWLKRQKT